MKNITKFLLLTCLGISSITHAEIKIAMAFPGMGITTEGIAIIEKTTTHTIDQQEREPIIKKQVEPKGEKLVNEITRIEPETLTACSILSVGIRLEHRIERFTYGFEVNITPSFGFPCHNEKEIEEMQTKEILKKQEPVLIWFGSQSGFSWCFILNGLVGFNVYTLEKTKLFVNVIGGIKGKIASFDKFDAQLGAQVCFELAWQMEKITVAWGILGYSWNFASYKTKQKVIEDKEYRLSDCNHVYSYVKVLWNIK